MTPGHDHDMICHHHEHDHADEQARRIKSMRDRPRTPPCSTHTP